jgi:GWxTD domain-containing protein
MSPLNLACRSLLRFVLAASILGAGSGQKKLKPEFEQFLSDARYIITSAERRAFTERPDAEKARFIEEFWKSRDTDPSTPENEFKDEYYGRIAKANSLFIGEGRPGWLTDRGRIHILFGPPSRREPSLLSVNTRGNCRELWYYGNFPVVFLDERCTGTYMLETFDLSPISQLSIAKEGAPKPFLAPQEAKPSFDFDVTLRKKPTEETRLEAVVDISIPFNSIWLSFEGGKFATTLEIRLELSDSQNSVRWETTVSYDLAYTAEELKQKLASRYEVAIPVVIEKGAETLGLGKNTLLVLLKNQKVGEEIRKKVEFSL